MMLSSFFGMALALATAGFIGASDFCGGLASRQGGGARVVVVSVLSGALVLLGLSLVWNEPGLINGDVGWATLAGVSGALAIFTIYRGLAMGNAAAVAPIAGVIGAALPAAFGMLTQGLPPFTQLAGFILAFPGIALVSQTESASSKIKKEVFLLAVLSGLFGAGFFTFLSQVQSDAAVLPALVAKAASLATAFMLVLLTPRSVLSPVPFRHISRIAIAGGVLDALASILFILAQQRTRLDVAVVLSSLYPAGTILLAALIQKEQISRAQGIGVILCLGAIVLIVA